MGKRARKRNRSGQGSGEQGRRSTTDYADGDGVLTFRDELSGGTLRLLEQLESKPAANAEDRWQRRTELLFEHLAVRWEIAGLPMESPKELLGRYRMASADERRRVREALAEHLRTRYPDLQV